MSRAARLAIGLACLGHFQHHVLTGLFLTLVVVLERAWERPFDELIGLWTAGALLVGAGAPVAGWLADRFGHDRLMAAFFLGAGAATMAAGLTSGPAPMAAALAALGLFGAIYHPVGLAWVSQAAPPEIRGRVMGFVGISGSIGVAAAALVAGGLAEFGGWRLALLLPGVLAFATGLGLAVLIARGLVGGGAPPAASRAAAEDTPARADPRVVGLLVLALSLDAVIYGAFTTAAPKWLSEALALGPERAAALGGLVALVFLAGSAAQLLGGWLADRMPLKPLYAATCALHVPLLLLAGLLGGWPALAVAALIVVMLDVGGPAENLLLARTAPRHRRGLAFGLRYAMSFLAAPVGIGLVAALHGALERGFLLLFLVLAGLAMAMLLAALALPGTPRRAAPQGQPLPAE